MPVNDFPSPPSGGVSDHGALTGLGDDDHSQYMLATSGTPTVGAVPTFVTGRSLTESGVTMDLSGNINTFGDIATSAGSISSGLAGISTTGNITVGGTVDGRDIAADGSKLDGIEAGADVTDATNVAAAGAVMDSDFGTSGIMVRTGAGAYDAVQINGSANITVADGDGVLGNPTISTVVDFVTQHATTAGTSGLVYLRCGSANNGASGVGGWAQAGFPYDATLIGYSVFEEITVYTSGAPVLRIIVVDPGVSSTTIDTTLATPSGTGNYYTTATVAAGTVDVDAGEFIAVALDHDESGSSMTTDDMVVRLYWRLT